MKSKLPSKVGDMARHAIPMDLYLDASKVFHWATKRHYQLWFTGEESKRHRRSEKVLHRLVKNGRLRSMYYGKKLIYITPKKVKGRKLDEFYGLSKVVHGLACTEGLVRFFRCRTDGVVVAERHFYGCGLVPEWGIIYPEGNMLLFEFSTKHNFFFSGKMRGKLHAYGKNLETIKQKFNAKPMVLFAIDVPKDTLERFLLGERAAGSVADALANTFFVDYKTFVTVPIGQQLTAPIYIWGLDGRQYPLSQNV